MAHFSFSAPNLGSVATQGSPGPKPKWFSPSSKSKGGWGAGEGSANLRLLVFLACLPLALVAYCLLVLGPTLDSTSAGVGDAGNGTSSEWGGRGGSGEMHSSCGFQARQKQFLFPLGQWHASLQPKTSPRLGIMTTTAAGLEQVLPWLYYHRTLGVEVFLIFGEGAAAEPENVAVLHSIPGVRVIPRDAELDDAQSYKPGRNKTLIWQMAGKPCNYELFVRQALNGDTAIPIAQEEGLDWLIHIDTDELLHPAGSPDFSLQTLLGSMRKSTEYVVFTNYETVVERDDVKEPFLEVTLFKKSAEHVAPELFNRHAREAQHGNPNYMLTYGNGKSAARVLPGLRSNGAHRFNNPMKAYKEVTLKEAAVLHYSYTRFSDLTSRRKRCGCKPTKKAVKSCFFLEFDRLAYIAASTMTEEQQLEWYREKVVWSDYKLVHHLLRKNIISRIFTPQVIMRGIYSSGILEATVKAGQEAYRKARLAVHLAQAPDGSMASSKAVDGAWGSLLKNVYGLVGSAQAQWQGQKRFSLKSLKLRADSLLRAHNSFKKVHFAKQDPLQT